MKQKSKLFFFACFAVLIGFAVLVVFAEIGLRFLPVNEGLRSLPVTEKSPVLRYESNRTSVWSRDWNFSIVNKIRTNNYGFVSDYDYKKQSNKPLIAVIGDSYVEAAMIPWQETGQSRLQRLLGENFRVYSFGVSGAALSQYLAYSKYVYEELRPAKIVILVVGNDFDESLIKYKNAPGFHYFKENHTGDLVLERIDYKVSLVRKLFRESALIRYLALNINLLQRWFALKELFGKNEYVGNTSSDVLPKRIRDSIKAVNAFLLQMATFSHLKPQQILFVLDGMRPYLYDKNKLKTAENSYYGKMREYFSEEAIRQGFNVIDMQPVFIEHFQKFRRKFEFNNDGHWNSLGHELFSNEVYKFLTAPKTTKIK